MNFFQLIQLFKTEYTIDYIVSLVILRHFEATGVMLSVSVVRSRLNNPISEYKHFIENFNDTLCAVAGVDVRAEIEARLRETELV